MEAEIERYGFFPVGGGAISLRIWPYEEANKPEVYELRNLGAYKGGKVVGGISSLPKWIAESEVEAIGRQLRELNLAQEVRVIESDGRGNYAYVQLDYERASVVISSIGTRDKPNTAVAGEIVSGVREFLEAGKACEKHLADQLLLPASLLLGERRCVGDGDVGGDWNVEIQKETSHFRTNQEIINKFFGT